jgi:hypothetical protein
MMKTAWNLKKMRAKGRFRPANCYTRGAGPSTKGQDDTNQTLRGG